MKVCKSALNQMIYSHIEVEAVDRKCFSKGAGHVFDFKPFQDPSLENIFVIVKNVYT